MNTDKHVRTPFSIVTSGIALVVSCSILLIQLFSPPSDPDYGTLALEADQKTIKWVDFTPTTAVLEQALNYDIQSHGTNRPLDWIELLAYAAAKNGGKFTSRRSGDIDKAAKLLKEGTSLEEVTDGLKFYDYFFQAYTAVLGGFVGEYTIEIADASSPSGKKTVTKYGLKVFSPIAKNYGYSHYDDFGNARSYGFRRTHLGNDLLGSVGTPIVAVESGVVEALGWNQYGGWRIGIRSADGKRYYYYAHLRKDHPYVQGLEVGSTVKAGDVVGYLGMTGYSTKENVNNIHTPHLHFGIQLIFDESKKDSPNQIWIDVYSIVNLLNKNRSQVAKNAQTKEYTRVYNLIE